MVHRRYVHPVIPWRHSYLFRQFVDAIYRTTHIASCNDKSLIYAGNRIVDYCHDIFLHLSLQLFFIDFLCLHHLLDIRTLKTSGYDIARCIGRGSIKQHCLLAADPLKVFLQIACGYEHSLLVAIGYNQTDWLRLGYECKSSNTKVFCHNAFMVFSIGAKCKQQTNQGNNNFFHNILLIFKIIYE